MGGARDALEVVLVAVDDHDAGSLGGERDGAGSPEPAGADHEGRSSREPQPVSHAYLAFLAS